MTREQLRQHILSLGQKFHNNGDKWPSPTDKHEWERANREWDAANNDDDSLIGRDGGSLSKGPKNADYFASRLGNASSGSVLDRAVSGWCRNQLGMPITGSDSAACDAYGISAASNVFVVNFAPSLPTTGAKLFRNALSSQDGSSGGFTVAGEFVRELEQAMLYSSGILQACSIMRTATGAPMPWPTADDTSNSGAQIGESTEVTELEPTFGAVVFDAYKFTSKLVRVPHELLRDSAINLAAELGKMLGTRIGRILNTKFTTGTGAATAKGLVTASTLGVTAASTTSIAFDELIDLMHSVDVSYRTADLGFGFMLHDSIAAQLRKLKDGDGNYIWQQSTQLGQPDRLLGWPVVINNDMDSSSIASAKTVLCGAFQKYKCRLVAELRLRRLVERYAEYDQEGFIAFQSADGNLLDAGTNPVKYLQQAAA